MINQDTADDRDDFGIAIIGMAGRFPDARNIDEYWENLRNGVESIRSFTAEELRNSGMDEATINDPNFVNAGTALPDADCFDARFFGINNREAEIMDPQHRVFLETAWEALEDAGYSSESLKSSVGVFGGVGQNTYFQQILVTRPDLLKTLGSYPIMFGSEKEYAVTRVSFKLNLKGPSFSVNTACSTASVAIHLACQSLLSGECDMALAGAARIGVPLKGGYLYEESGIQSPDGHCRAFDVDARGTVVGDGVGIVVLKRLSDALRDGDHLRAVIKGSAINNDGSQKVGFSAPSVEGQASVIEEALAIANVDAESIGYVETHGTGTSLGDPIEIAALTKAYRNWTEKKEYCPIGSVKTNIGHLDAAAGAAGVIKTVLMLENRSIPPSLNFKKPNPEIGFNNTPFYVNSELNEWKSTGGPLRAGVSSFGLGGTNAHIILEEVPKTELSKPGRSRKLMVISAKTQSALDRATKNITDYLRKYPEGNLNDIAYTLQVGRRKFDHRRAVVCESRDDAINALDRLDPASVITSTQDPVDRETIFMFSGQGAQYVNMGLELYRCEPIFRQIIDQCADLLRPYLSRDLREVIYPDEAGMEQAVKLLDQTIFTQPALFTIEYALAKLWIEWGKKPTAMVGHSIGEYVAACLAGVFSLEDALRLVAARGRLMQDMPGGAMLAVPMGEDQLKPHLNAGVSVAVTDSPSLSIVSGEYQAIKEFEDQISKLGVEVQRVHTSHAFHSGMMEPVREPFKKEVEKARLNPPEIPFVSNVSGTWISKEQATNPEYWSQQLVEPVRLAECLRAVMITADAVLLEVGPGRSLIASARRNTDKGSNFLAFSSTRHPKEDISDLTFILTTLGKLWVNGVHVNWPGFHSDEALRRVSLPTYPFERKRFWVKPGKLYDSTGLLHGVMVNELEQDHLDSDSGSGRPMQSTRADGPKTDIELKLADIWKGLLGVEDPGVNDNFFDLGGSSLLATRLLTQIAGVFGKKLPLSTIFEAPTIGTLAGLLDDKVATLNTKRYSSLVKIQDGGSRPPFFCIPGNLGNVFVDFEYLYRYLGNDQPFYGLQDGLGNPSKVEALAASYVRDIRNIQPHGPYFLAGVCLGGVIAFEMAQQLIEQAEQVAFLALVEPATLSLPGDNSYLDVFNDIWTRFTRPRSVASKSIKMSLSELVTFIRLRIKLIANIWSLKLYSPVPFQNHYYLFLTRESMAKSSFQGWRKFAAGGIDVQEIPGTHRSITGDNERIEEDQMRVLGEKLKAGIHKALDA